MIKTQVQIPDELYRRAKQIAKEREWSLAEVMRRGLEYMDRTHPPLVEPVGTLPLLDATHFSVQFDDQDFRAIAHEDETNRGLER